MKVVDFDNEEELELDSRFLRRVSRTNKEDRLKKQPIVDNAYQRDKRPRISRETIRINPEES